MPLLAQLYPRIGTTAEHGFDVPAEMLQRVEHVFLAVIADFASVDRDERGVFVGKESFFLQQRLECHTVVLAEEREYHIEVDK